MSIKTKNSGSYADIVGVFHKRAGAYEAVQGVYAKSGGVYGRVDFSVTPSLAVSRVDGVGPLGVVFDATATTASSGDAFHDLLYFFDFGDGTSANYTYGTLAGTTKNRFVGGPVSCHVYETPGSYTATLWVYDGSKIWGPVTQAITVSDPDVVYAGALTTVVSTDGDFTGAPSGAVQVTSSDFDAQGTVMTSNRRVLFKRGQTFDASATTSRQSATVNLTVGVFGAGTDYATVRATANSVTCLQGLANGGNYANNLNNWRVFGLHFTRADAITGGIGFNTNITIAPTLPSDGTRGYTTIHKCKSSRLDRGFTVQGVGNVVSSCVVDSVNDGVAVSGGLPLFTTAVYQNGVIDCSFDAAGGGEHTFRAQGGIVQCVISSEFRRCAPTKHLMTLRGSTVYLTQFYVAAGNIADGSTTAGAVDWVTQIAPNASSANEPIERVRFEGNFVIANDQAAVGTIIEASNIAVRSNVYLFPATVTRAASTGVSVAYSNTAGLANPIDNRVQNNSVVYQSNLGFTAIQTAANTSNSSIKGNIAYAPSAIRSGTTGTDGPKFLIDGATGTVASNNSTDSQVKNTDPLFNGALTSMAGFKLQTGSPYKNAGGNFKNWIDGLGYLRKVANQYDAGGMNSVDKQTDAWTLIA